LPSKKLDLHNSVDAKGHLLKGYLPAMYWDTSVVIDYWISGVYYEHTVENNPPANTSTKPRDDPIEQLFNLDDKIKSMCKIRERLYDKRPNVLPVITPLAVLELMKWYSDERVRKLIFSSSFSGMSAVERQGKRGIAEKLKKIYKLEIKEESDGSNPFEESIEKYSGNRRLFRDTILDPDFADHCGLLPIVHANIMNFNLTLEDAWSTPSICAFLQMGGADIIHLMLAKHLGCKYFATSDSDFVRVKEPIFEELGIKVVKSPEEILRILYSRAPYGAPIPRFVV
jgi:hypothetical protein